MSRTHVSEFLDPARLPQLEAEGFLTSRSHSSGLLVWNYTAKCAYDRTWTPETLNCRGLITDADGFVHARPFPKFFNLGEHNEPWPERWEATEKLDGSLGIAFRNPNSGRIEIATRGSFESQQARWATDWWARTRGDVEIPDGQTWLFEIVYPDNRIVVDYGGRAELVLLAVIENATGNDLARPDWGGATARVFDAEDSAALVATCPEPGNFEGYVVRDLDTDRRVKVKLDEYVRLHRLLTQVTPRHIWELFVAGQKLDSLLDRVPDEFFGWAAEWEGRLRRDFARAMAQAWAALADPACDYRDRRATAAYFKGMPNTPALFKLYDGRDPSDLIWKTLKPPAARALRADSDAMEAPHA